MGEPTEKTNRKRRLSSREMKQQVMLLRERLFHVDLAGAGPGDQLPSENEIANRYGSSLAVIRKLYSELQAEGIAKGRQGKGIFLTECFRLVSPAPSSKHLKIAIICFIEKSHPQSHTSAASRLLAGFEAHGAPRHCQSRLYNLWPSRNLTPEMLHNLKAEQVDGILFISNPYCPSTAIITELQRLAIPLVVHGIANTPAINTIVFDHTQIAQLATNHLVFQGRKKLAFLQYEGTDAWQCDRRQGFRASAEKAGAETVTIDIPHDDDHPGAYADFITSIAVPLLLKEGTTGVFCSGDIFAAALIDGLRKKDILVPQDLSIVGADDDWSVRDYDITTIQVDAGKLGEAAYELLSELIAAPPSTPIQRKIHCPLIIRSTS